jgi:hypothetical protein
MARARAPKELILVAKPALSLPVPEDLPVTAEHSSALELANSSSLEQTLAAHGAWLEPLFGLRKSVEFDDSPHLESMDVPASSRSGFYEVMFSGANAEDLAAQLRADPNTEAVYVKPGLELTTLDEGRTLAAPELPPVTPSLRSMQGYLGAPTTGINALAAWDIPGGDGTDIQIVDIEGAWLFTHEDLKDKARLIEEGQQSPELDWRNHGTAVLGVFSGDRNSVNGNDVGITGICPEANVIGVPVFGQPNSSHPDVAGSAAAIRQGADALRPGDIMLLELQLPGPPDFAVRNDQQGYIPIEWWPDNLEAIQYAVTKGVIVVAAAGNGGVDLDSDIYDQQPQPPHGPFPEGWKNPFRRDPIDSGSILVGAGAPPPFSINETDLGPDRSRLAFSNYSRMVDAQGWGGEVTTCGFGNLQKGHDENRWYRIDFNGTSSAAPMVAGALACVQGVLKKAGQPLLTPARARKLLIDTGSKQTNGPNGTVAQRIGNRPNIIAMLTDLGFSLN